MPNGANASRNPAAISSSPALPLRPLPWPEASQARGAAGKRHAHSCLCCGATYDCLGPEEIGYCAPVCQPCYWIQLSSQLRVYKEVVTELERQRAGIERRVGMGICRRAGARHRKMKNHANLLVAFGQVLSTQGPMPKFTRPGTEA
jgi:hypothetical protein